MAMPPQYAAHNNYGGYGQGGYGGYGPGGGYGPPGDYSGQPLMQGGYGGGPQGPGQGYPPQGYAPQGPAYPQHGGYPSNAASNSLRQMQTTTSMNLVFFFAACCVMLGATIGGLFLFVKLEWVDFLSMSYLFFFGAILAVLDTPFFKTIKAMGDVKMYIGKYINLLTRVTGKGVTFLFIGSALFCLLWDNLEGVFIRFLAVVLCLVPFVVGLAAVVIGVMKSVKLGKAQAHIKHIEGGALEQRYNQWAQTFPGPNGGLTPLEFNNLTMDNGGFKWEDADLKLIFNALVSNPAWRINSVAQSSAGRAPSEEPKIPKEDLMSWVKGGLVWL